MIDFHAHVLPGMDDGSRDVEESLAMLHAAAQQGIHCIAATSHFYPTDEDPARFLRRRAEAYAYLADAVARDPAACPRIVLGAEVYYFNGIGSVDAVETLRIEGTPFLLVEMPFSRWTDGMVAELLRLQGKAGTRIVLAHIERYLKYQDRDVWDELQSVGILMQSNAEFFLDWMTRRKALKMLKSGFIDFLGSDCHNIRSRPQRMGEALRAIGPEGQAILEDNVRRWTPGLADPAT